MERLTQRCNCGICGSNERVLLYPLYKIGGDEYTDYGLINQCFEKLAMYEDLEEQGLLLRLPCKVGDTVYPIMVVEIEFGKLKYEVYEAKVRRFHIDVFHLCVEMTITETAQILELVAETFGETVFLTREEADAKLEKLKGEEHE